MKNRYTSLVLAIILIAPGYIVASPIYSDNLINIFQLDTLEDYHSSFSADSEYQNTYAGGVEAFGNLNTGEVGSASNDSVNSIVSMYDTLTFSSYSDVSFSYTWDGSLFKGNQFSSPYGQGRIDIYDITDLDYWLETSDFFGVPDVSVVSDAQDVSLNIVSIDMNSIDVNQEGGWEEIPHELADGVQHQVSYELTDTISVDPSKVYGIRLMANTYGGGTGSVANFLDTGTFNFTDLGGSTFTSGSGQFLRDSTPVAVPEPGSIGLFSLGLLGLLLGISRRRPVQTLNRIFGH